MDGDYDSKSTINYFQSLMAIYDLVVPRDNMLRKINDLVDFSFVYDAINRKISIG
jgi:hypothetical protein